MILGIAALTLGLVVWGAHPLAPLRLPPAARRRAALVGGSLAVAALMMMSATTAEHPDGALAMGLGPGLPVSVEGRLVAVLLGAALISDGLAFFLAGVDGPGARGLAAALGFAGLVGFAVWGELMRVGEGPSGGITLFWLAVCLRALVGLGAGELVLVGRGRLGPLAGVALLAYPVALPSLLRLALERGGDWLNLGAAGALFLLSRFLPGRLARFALAAAVVLAAIFFVRTAELSQRLQEVFPELWPPPTGR